MLKGFDVNYLYTNSIKMVILQTVYMHISLRMMTFVLFCIGYIIVLVMYSLVVDI